MPVFIKKPHASRTSFVDEQGEIVYLFIAPLLQKGNCINYSSGEMERIKMILPNGASSILEYSFEFGATARY